MIIQFRLKLDKFYYTGVIKKKKRFFNELINKNKSLERLKRLL